LSLFLSPSRAVLALPEREREKEREREREREVLKDALPARLFLESERNADCEARFTRGFAGRLARRNGAS